VWVSYYIFRRFEHAALLYALLGLYFSIQAGASKKHKDMFLSLNDRERYFIPCMERFAKVFPFVLALLYAHHVLLACALLLVPFVPFTISPLNLQHRVIPTPFSHRPFEFIVGFRKSVFVFLVAYFFAVAAVFASNLNLALFAILLIYFTCMNFYVLLEDDYHVWIHAQSPQNFLKQKIYTAIRFSFFLSAPIVLTCLPFFLLDIPLLLAGVLLGSIYLGSMVVAKYSVFPNDMHMLTGFMIALSVTFPPILLLLVPYLYRKAVQSLSIYLS
jgi:hypothetical protein